MGGLNKLKWVIFYFKVPRLGGVNNRGEGEGGMGEKLTEIACGSNADAADTQESNVERNIFDMFE